ncbi:YdeI/OmpD-associated family protein [Microbacterium sp. HD4P20]|uniref:YdeI/OmpD-associated family protein n=1 Tax=Microbacterium sp. HD4P20 TaxID=2864874 RepID=UPI001C643620|nr:YdeI/OmpD-associated family protein [Microbacterium sp. HD4P20]MCP2635603.1 YdeI/OmpD-associated family protein [Microbacterium sp. HD4P20]
MGALDDGERVEATDAAAWRAWLAEHHTISKGAWLVRPRPGSGLDLIGYEDAILQALCFGWIDGPVRSFDEQRGGLWFAPRRPTSGWAATNKARVAKLEAEGLLTAAGIRAIEVAKANGSWAVLDNAEALREPDDLTAALDAVPAAREAWDAFPPSTRKVGISNVDLARRDETRAARIAKIVADAAEGRRP